MVWHIKMVSEDTKKQRVGPAILVKRAANRPASLARISFEGTKDLPLRTKRDALVKETAELFGRVNTFKDLVVGANVAKQHLEHVGLFNNVGVVIDIDKKGSDSDSYELKFIVTEPKSPVGMNIEVSSSGEALTRFSIQNKNLLGRGEAVTFSTVTGHRQSSLYSLGLLKPLLGWQRYSGVSLQGYRTFENSTWGKYSNLETGLTALMYYKPGQNLRHDIRWVGAWRNINCMNDAAFEIRTHSGHTLKSSLINELDFSTLDATFIPAKGIGLKLYQELAGLGGDVKFFRNNVEFKASTKLFLGLILSTGFQASYIQPMSGPTLPIVDRVFLGGPANLRGFKLNSVGPQADNCYLGGIGSWCTGLHLYRTLPFPAWQDTRIFAHLFGVAGNIHQVDAHSSLGDVFRSLGSAPRVCAGLGLAIRFLNMCQIEINYNIPLQWSAQDVIQSGLQFGIGVNFI